MTETALSDLLAGDLSELDLVAVMIDGVHFAEHLCVVALGIDIDGTQAPARGRGGLHREHHPGQEPAGWAARAGPGHHPPDSGRVLDGAKALTAAVKEVFDQPVIGRCQLHKLRNVGDHLPERMRGPVEKRMRAAYRRWLALEAEALLTALAKELDKTHPGAAASLRRASPKR